MKKITNLGVRRVLSILGSMSALLGATCAYGPAPAYGVPPCTDDTDCGAGWYCEKSNGTGYCASKAPDGGTTDKDGGQ